MTNAEYQYIREKLDQLTYCMGIVEDHKCKGYILMEGAKSALEDVLEHMDKEKDE